MACRRRRGGHRSHRFAAAVVLCAGALIALTGAEVADTGLYNPIPADASGDPQDLFHDNDALFAYVTSDIKGGSVCVVAEGAAGNCNAPAWGGENRVVGIGTVYTLVAGPTLPPGRWQLISENSIGELTGRSPTFTVLPCPGCPRSIGAAAAAAFKNKFGQLSLYASATCDGWGIKDKVDDNDLTGIVGEMVAHGTTAPSGVRQSTYNVATAIQFVAISAGFQAISFASAGSALTKAPEKAMAILKDLSCALKQMEEDIRKDPPDPNYGSVEQPTFATISPLGDAATDALARSIDRQTGYAVAILRALERYQGAEAAGSQAGVSRQTKALGSFTRSFVNELRTGAGALRAYADAIGAVPELAEPVIADVATRTALAALYARVRTDGFTAAERAELVALGYTPTQIDGIRSQFGGDPAALPVGVGLAAIVRQAADGLEEAIPTLDAFAREATAVGARANVAPVAGFTAAPQSGPAPLAVQFSDASTSPDSDPVTFSWSFGDFGSSTLASPTHTYTTNGTFVARQTVCDAYVCSSTTKVITVGPTVPANVPPVANDDSGTAPSGGQVVIDVKANDTDPDGDALRIAGATDPPHGRANCSVNCQYLPDDGYLGPDSFEYTISDDRGGTDTATVSITVGPPANRAPHAVADKLTTTQGVAASLNVLANDTDPDDDALSVVANGTAFRATVSCAPAGVCTFTPEAGFAGTSSFNYTVSDGRGGTSIALVTVTVAPGAPPPNEPPVAVDDAATVIAGAAAVPFDILANDSDPNGDAIYVSGVAGSPAGTLTCSSSGSCTFVPQSGFLGDTGFTYTVADGRGGTDTGAVALHVAADGRRPIPLLTKSPLVGFAPVGVSFDARGSSDQDGEIVSYRWEFGDGGEATGALVSHTYTTAGTYAGSLTVTDDDGLSATLAFTFTAQSLTTLTLPICGDQDGSETPLVFRCPEYGPVQDVQLYRVAGTGDVDVAFDFVLREAALNNELAVVPVDDAAATIDGVSPGQPGYYLKAFARAQVVFPTGSTATAPDKTLTFPAGTLLMFVIGQGTSIAHVAQINPENALNKGSNAFFSLDALNPDSADHMMAYTRSADGRNEFGWEDLIATNGGDFNDIVYTVDAALRPLGQVVVTKAADAATTATGGTNGYTITVSNSATGAVAIQSIQDTLPTGFSYVAGATTGVTTSNPVVSGSTLTWNGPFVLPRGETLTLHFGVRVATAAGTYLNNATVDAAGFAVTPTGPTAPIEVTAPANRSPDALDDSLTTDEGVPGSVSVLANDTDPDGDALTITTKTDGANGTVACASGSCTYTPAARFSGADSFTYTISDGRGGTDTATVSVTVRRVLKSTSTTYTGAASVQYSDAAALSGTLRDTSVAPPVGVADKALGFTLGTQSASAGPTGATGAASTSLIVTQQPGSTTTVRTAFAGDAAYQASGDEDTFAILKEDCTLTYSGPLTIPPLALTTLAADLGELDASLGDRSGKTISFAVTGTADPTLRTFTATTGPNGTASTLAALPADVYAVTASFAGDAYYLGCETAADVLVTMAEATAKVTGGGWISIAVGRTSFGFNAIPQADGTWKGQLQIRMKSGKDRYHAKTVSTLTSTRDSATWSGTGSWNGVPGYAYTVSIVDNGSSGGKKSDTISIVIAAPGGATQFTTKGPQPLKGGNITVH